MRRFVVILVSLMVVVTSLSARQLENFFVSRPEQRGMIYFLTPQQLFGGRGVGELSYDLTVREYIDSCTMNFTYRSERPMPCDSIDVKSTNGLDISGGVKRLYIERQKGEWVHRYSLEGCYSSFVKLYDADSAPVITIYSGGKSYLYPAIKGAWRKYAPIGEQIFQTIELNAN